MNFIYRVLIFLFLVSDLPAWSQVNIKIQKLIGKADSVVLVSNLCNEPNAEIRFEGITATPEPEEIYLITSKNKLDYRAVIQRKTLTAIEQNKLGNIFLHLESGGHPGRKCIPLYRHTILIYTGNKTSWVQVCFHCFQAETSRNLSKSFGYSDALMAKLWELFKSKGITHDLPDYEHVKRFFRNDDDQPQQF